jgi:hypothetical protein
VEHAVFYLQVRAAVFLIYWSMMLVTFGLTFGPAMYDL